MTNDSPNGPTDCPARQPINPDKPSPDWFLGCWNVKVGRAETHVKIATGLAPTFDIYFWQSGQWLRGDVLTWNPRTYTLESGARCISYWYRKEAAVKDRIFAHWISTIGQAMPFEAKILGSLAADIDNATDVAWGAEEEGG